MSPFSRPAAFVLPVLALVSGSLGAGERRAAVAQGPTRTKLQALGLGQKRGDDPLGHVEWMRERMGGDLPASFMDRFLRVAERERARHADRYFLGRPVPAALTPGVNRWVNLGPTSSAFNQSGPGHIDSGRTRVILPDPADATGNTLYVLNAGGGLWKTTNFLADDVTWVPLTDAIGSTAGGSVAFGRDTSTLYLGLGDPFDLNIGGFMVRSTDGGQTWAPHQALGSATRVMDVKVDSAGAQDRIMVGTNKGLFQSVNGGDTYGPVASISDSATVWSLVRTSAGWFALVREPGAGGRLFRSSDGAAAWVPVAGAPPGIGRTTLAVGQPGDAIVYAFAAQADDSGQKDLYRSDDGGLTWRALGLPAKRPTNPNGDQPDLNVMHNQAWYNQMLLVDPADPGRNTVYLGGNLSSVATRDGGATWTILSSWAPDPGFGTQNLPYVHADFHCAAASQFGGVPRLYFGNDGGIFTSTDAGVLGASGHWTSVKNVGLATHLLYALAVNPWQPGSVIAGLQDNGTRLRVGSTAVFNEVTGGDGFGVGWSQADGRTTLASYVYNTISRCTTDPAQPANWSPFMDGLDPTAQFFFVTPIVTPPASADPTGKVFFTYGEKGVFRSDANRWHAMGTVSARRGNHGLGVSPLDLQRVAVAGPNGVLSRTLDGGQTWASGNLINLIPNWNGSNANLAWSDLSQLYVCSEATAPGSVRVARSFDGGATWRNPGNAGLPDIPVSKLVVDPNDGTGNTVYAATWLGVYQTTDGGAQWSLLGAGLPQVRVTDLYLAPDSSYLRVSTWGRGVWEIANAPEPGSVSVTPTHLRLAKGATHPFTATIIGGGTATWSSTGSVNASGLFTATATGAFTVTAEAAGRSALAHVYVPPVEVKAIALWRPLLTGEVFPFTAKVTGTVNTAVTWSASLGSIEALTGVYQAPSSPAVATLTATSLDDATQSSSFPVQVEASTQILPNSGFEAGASGWTLLHDGQPLNFVFDNTAAQQYGFLERARSGQSFAWMNGAYGDQLPHVDILSQEVEVPDVATGLVLSLWVNVASTDTGTTARDFLHINLVDDQNVVHPLGQLSNLDRSGYPGFEGYVNRTYDVSAFKGRKVTLQLVGSETAAQATGFLIDDVALTAFAPTTGPKSLNLNADEAVDVRDLLVLARDWGKLGPSDLDGLDGVDDKDLLLLLAGIGK